MNNISIRYSYSGDGLPVTIYFDNNDTEQIQCCFNDVEKLLNWFLTDENVGFLSLVGREIGSVHKKRHIKSIGVNGVTVHFADDGRPPLICNVSKR